jgi:hypothetical protein
MTEASKAKAFRGVDSIMARERGHAWMSERKGRAASSWTRACPEVSTNDAAA